MDNRDYKDTSYSIISLDEFFGDYSVATVDEYFRLLDMESKKRSQLIAKSLNRYLKQVKSNSKYDELKKSALTF